MNAIHLLKIAYSGSKKYAAEKDNFLQRRIKSAVYLCLKTTRIDYISIDIDPEFHILCLQEFPVISDQVKDGWLVAN